SSAGRFQRAGTSGLGAAQARPTRRAQARPGRDGVRARPAHRRSDALDSRSARPDSAPIWRRRPPAQSGARLAARGKKTALSAPPIASPLTVVSSYELLRRVALGHSGPTDGPSLGFTLLLRQGLTAWLRAWTTCPRVAAPAPSTTVAFTEIPSVIQHELV